MMHSAPLAPGSRPGAFFGGARSLHIAAGSGQEEARFRPCHGREDAPAAFLRPRKPICPQLPTRGLAFSDVGAVRTRRSQNAHGFGSGPSAAEKIFLLKSILNMHFLQSGGAAHLAGANNSDHPRPPRAGGGPREKRCRVSL